MKTIRVSDEVWNAIAAQGRFGETEDIVLRRIFKLPTEGEGGDQASVTSSSPPTKAYAWKERRTEVRMFQTVTNGKLALHFENGPRKEWGLPPKEDAPAIRKVRDSAVAWVREHGGTDGQVGAAMRALTSR